MVQRTTPIPVAVQSTAPSGAWTNDARVRRLQATAETRRLVHRSRRRPPHLGHPRRGSRRRRRRPAPPIQARLLAGRRAARNLRLGRPLHDAAPPDADGTGRGHGGQRRNDARPRPLVNDSGDDFHGYAYRKRTHGTILSLQQISNSAL
ncbi:hypothetical protein D1007_07784 [Hordeum vulgare]|nr:hypothetical protein D1007_07784 [Hordeum vulgare]